jgi:hypothetical protein
LQHESDSNDQRCLLLACDSGELRTQWRIIAIFMADMELFE